MSMHTRAFGEMNFLIYGQEPLVPMKLEQTFAQARPSDEIRFDSFENYDQAYDFAKDNKNVGLIFMLENCGEMDINSVYKQFKAQSEFQQTCFGVLIHNGQETFKGLRAFKENDELIAYYDVNDLLDIDKAPFLLKEIWEKYQEAFEKQVIPTALAQTYRSMAMIHSTEEEIVFQQRLSTLLSGEMNVSWQEGFLLKWHPILKVLCKDENNLIKANQTLNQLYQHIQPTESHSTIEGVANSQQGIAAKIIIATNLLSKISSIEEMTSYLNSSLQNVTPRSKALLRIIKKHHQKIIEFHQSSNQEKRKPLLKVV